MLGRIFLKRKRRKGRNWNWSLLFASRATDQGFGSVFLLMRIHLI